MAPLHAYAAAVGCALALRFIGCTLYANRARIVAALLMERVR